MTTIYRGHLSCTSVRSLLPRNWQAQFGLKWTEMFILQIKDSVLYTMHLRSPSIHCGEFNYRQQYCCRLLIYQCIKLRKEVIKKATDSPILLSRLQCWLWKRLKKLQLCWPTERTFHQVNKINYKHVTYHILAKLL